MPKCYLGLENTCDVFISLVKPWFKPLIRLSITTYSNNGTKICMAIFHLHAEIKTGFIYCVCFTISCMQLPYLQCVPPGAHRVWMTSPHKWPVTRRIFPFDDVIMQNWLRIYTRRSQWTESSFGCIVVAVSSSDLLYQYWIINWAILTNSIEM